MTQGKAQGAQAKTAPEKNEIFECGEVAQVDLRRQQGVARDPSAITILHRAISSFPSPILPS